VLGAAIHNTYTHHTNASAHTSGPATIELPSFSLTSSHSTMEDGLFQHPVFSAAAHNTYAQPAHDSAPTSAPQFMVPTSFSTDDSWSFAGNKVYHQHPVFAAAGRVARVYDPAEELASDEPREEVGRGGGNTMVDTGHGSVDRGFIWEDRSASLSSSGVQGEYALPIHELSPEDLESAVDALKIQGEDLCDLAIIDCIALMEDHPNDAEVQSRGLAALFLLCIDSDDRREKIAQSGGLDAMIAVILNHKDFEYQAQACTTIYSLSIAPKARQFMATPETVGCLVTAIFSHRMHPEVVVMALKALKLLTMPSSQSCSSVKQHLKKFTAEPESLLLIILELQDPAFEPHAEILSDMVAILCGES